jgi:hypothetical protein
MPTVLAYLPIRLHACSACLDCLNGDVSGKSSGEEGVVDQVAPGLLEDGPHTKQEDEVLGLSFRVSGVSLVREPEGAEGAEGVHGGEWRECEGGVLA